MVVCIVWEKVRKGVIALGVFNLFVFISLVIVYVLIAKFLIELFDGPELVFALVGSGLGFVFIATYVFHVAVDAFRIVRKLDKETNRGLEICA